MKRRAALVLTALALACTPADDERPAEGIVVDEVVWMLDWAEASEDSAWTIVTDDGDTLSIEDGWVISYSAALVPCAEDHQDRGHGHSLDPSATTEAMLEWVVDASAIEFASLSFDPARYCSVQFVFGPGYQGLAELDDEDIGTSLKLLGTLTPAGAEEGEPIEIIADAPVSVYLPLDLEDVDEPAALEVRFVRDFAAAFEGVDLHDEDAGMQVLTNLVEGTTLDVVALDSDDD